MHTELIFRKGPLPPFLGTTDFPACPDEETRKEVHAFPYGSKVLCVPVARVLSLEELESDRFSS
jgi:hypothetical protein